MHPKTSLLPDLSFRRRHTARSPPPPRFSTPDRALGSSLWHQAAGTPHAVRVASSDGRAAAFAEASRVEQQSHSPAPSLGDGAFLLAFLPAAMPWGCIDRACISCAKPTTTSKRSREGRNVKYGKTSKFGSGPGPASQPALRAPARWHMRCERGPPAVERHVIPPARPRGTGC